MEWTRQKLAHYLGDIRTTVEFRGITGPELTQALHDEAVMRLQYVAQIVYSEYMTDEEKTQAIAEIIGHP